MLGFGALRSAQRFCSAYEEVRQYLRPRRRRKQFVSLATQRQQFTIRVQALQSSFHAR
jgi:putative transposase